MTKARDALLVLVTAPNLKTARMLAKKVLESRLAACVNLVPHVESHYWWQGKVQKGSEVLMLLKSTRHLARRLEDLVIANHPYDTPEFVALPVQRANKRYLSWWIAATAQGKT